MTQVGPLVVTAHNGAQAEYLVRTRAQQRGIKLQAVDVADAGTGTWFVTVTVEDADTARVAEAALDEDTTVMHFRNHPHRPRAE